MSETTHRVTIRKRNRWGVTETGYSAWVKDEFQALEFLRRAQPTFGTGTLEAVTEDGQVAAHITFEVSANEVFDRA